MIMIVAYIYPVLLMPLPQESSIYVTLNTIGQPMFMGLAVAVLALLHKDGKPFYDVEKFIGSDIMWGAIAAYALVSVASGAVASDAAGINAWLQIVISSVVADLPLAVVLIVFLLIATYLTQVFSNMATIIIISSVLAPMLPLFVEQGFNVSVIPAFVLQGGMSAIMTAGGSGFAAMMLAQPAFEGDGGAWKLAGGHTLVSPPLRGHHYCDSRISAVNRRGQTWQTDLNASRHSTISTDALSEWGFPPIPCASAGFTDSVSVRAPRWEGLDDGPLLPPEPQSMDPGGHPYAGRGDAGPGGLYHHQPLPF